MKRSVITMILIPVLTLLPAVVFMEPVYAACGQSPSARLVDNGIEQANLSPSSDCGENGVETAISTAVRILSIIVGIAAVIVIIVSGFKYITSGGDSGKI